MTECLATGRSRHNNEQSPDDSRGPRTRPGRDRAEVGSAVGYLEDAPKLIVPAARKATRQLVAMTRVGGAPAPMTGSPLWEAAPLRGPFGEEATSLANYYKRTSDR